MKAVSHPVLKDVVLLSEAWCVQQRTRNSPAHEMHRPSWTSTGV
jgi:hypothetical protein